MSESIDVEAIGDVDHDQAALDQLAEDGYAVIQRALSAEQVERLCAAAGEFVANAAEQPDGATLDEPVAVHLLGAAFAHPEFTELATNDRLVRLVATVLTPNIHVYHSHLDIHPPEPPAANAWRWHEDGGRMTADVEQRIMLSLKVGYFLTDVETDGYGNLEVIPGSHRWSAPLPRTPGTAPDGAIPVLAHAGDAVVFDRRIWHSRGTNTSDRTRKVIFFGYAPRWIAQRETGSAEQLENELSPLRRQLLGCADWDSCHVARAELPVQQLLVG